jgi:hypothetical protein
MTHPSPFRKHQNNKSPEGLLLFLANLSFFLSGGFFGSRFLGGWFFCCHGVYA